VALMPEAGAQRIGLFGGSFDPPHIGHVALVEAALDILQLDAVWVIPAGLPVHRSLSGVASPVQRMQWMQHIFAGNERVQVLDWEVVRDEPTPSIVTLRFFAQAFPDKWPVLLLGADAFSGMDEWVEYPEHVKLCDVAVFGRASYPASDAGADFRIKPLSEWLKGSVAMGSRVNVDVKLPDMSATAIRKAVVNKENLAGMVPECARQEIEQAYAGLAV